MELSYKNKVSILNKLPHLEFSYAKISHKKIQHNKNNIFITIPKGNKYFAWFYNNNNKNMCYILSIDNKQRYSINNIKIYNIPFNNILTINKGTILYGTMFNMNNVNFFNIENIYYYKGKYIYSNNFYNKLNIMHDFFKNIRQHSYTNNNIIFGLPIIANKYNDIINQIDNIKYDLYAIQIINLYNNKIPNINKKIVNAQQYICNFLIKPDIISDIYNLYFIKDNKLTYFDKAIINDYKTSVLMNNIFRDIKENINLDYLEESDDEDSFENISPDKFIKNNIQSIMECKYNKIFNKWCPIKVIKIINNDHICIKDMSLIINKHNIPCYH